MSSQSSTSSKHHRGSRFRSTTSSRSSSSSTRTARVDLASYNPTLYNTHAFVMRLIPSATSPSRQTNISGQIVSSSTPRPDWTPIECQEWLEQVLMKREGLGPREARNIAERVNCGGGELYVLSERMWGDVCAGDVDGEGEKGWKSRGKGKREEKVEIGRRICGMLRRRRVEIGI